MVSDARWAGSSAIPGGGSHRLQCGKLYEDLDRESIGPDFRVRSTAAVPATSELGQLFDHKQTTRGHATIRAVDPKPTSTAALMPHSARTADHRRGRPLLLVPIRRW